LEIRLGSCSNHLLQQCKPSVLCSLI